MFKQILLLVLISFSTAQAKAELGDHLIDSFWDIFDNPGTFLPDINTPNQPLDLYDKGPFTCYQCRSIDSTTGSEDLAKYASNLIFGKSRVVNLGDRGYANLTPYANGVEGLQIVLSNGMSYEVRVSAMNTTTLSGLARRNGGCSGFCDRLK